VQRDEGVIVEELIIEQGDGELNDVTIKLLRDAASHIKLISSLVIDMFACDCSDAQAANILEIFTTSKSTGNDDCLSGKGIKKIKLDFSETKVCKNTMNVFVEALGLNRSSLKHLELSVARCKINNSELEFTHVPFILDELSFIRFDFEESRLHRGFTN